MRLLLSFRTLGRGNGIQDEASDALDETDHILHSYGHRENHLWKPRPIQANKKLYRQIEIAFYEYNRSGQHLAFKTGSGAIFYYIHILAPRLKKIRNPSTAMISELERPSKDRGRAVERAWKEFLKICTKERRKSPSRGEFVAGVKSATQAVIHLMELGDSVYQERLSKGLGLFKVKKRSGKLLRRSST